MVHSYPKVMNKKLLITFTNSSAVKLYLYVIPQIAVT